MQFPLRCRAQPRQIDVMILYSEEAMRMLGKITDTQMEMHIAESLSWTNDAFVTSKVALSMRPVYVGQVRYDIRLRAVL